MAPALLRSPISGHHHKQRSQARQCDNPHHPRQRDRLRFEHRLAGGEADGDVAQRFIQLQRALPVAAVHTETAQRVGQPGQVGQRDYQRNHDAFRQQPRRLRSAVNQHDDQEVDGEREQQKGGEVVGIEQRDGCRGEGDPPTQPRFRVAILGWRGREDT